MTPKERLLSYLPALHTCTLAAARAEQIERKMLEDRSERPLRQAQLRYQYEEAKARAAAAKQAFTALSEQTDVFLASLHPQLRLILDASYRMQQSDAAIAQVLGLSREHVTRIRLSWLNGT